MPVSLLDELDQLPVHESCNERLKHIVIPSSERTSEAVQHELTRQKVCAVSWRWNGLPPARARLRQLKNWSPMSDYQLQRLKEAAARSRCDYVWIDWVCVPQLSSNTMRFVNASYEVYSFADAVAFIPRIKKLKRNGWGALSQQTAAETVSRVRASAQEMLSSKKFSKEFTEILRDTDRVLRAEAKLRAPGWTNSELEEQVESALKMLLRLLEGNDVYYPTFDYYGRAWTLAERLVRFKPSVDSPFRLGQIHTAGDALLYSMAGFWRNVEKHGSAYPHRPVLTASDLNFAVYVRGVDPNEEGVHELWEDMNQLVQLAPGILGVASEVAALAVICVEWLLHGETGTRDATGRLATELLGECVAFTAIGVTGASMHEEANIEWFRKYLYFQAGSIYESTLQEDLILAVYRGCGLPERETANEAIQASLDLVVGSGTEPSARGPAVPGVDRLCREAVLHKELHTHMLSKGAGKQSLAISDFSPLLASLNTTGTIRVSEWHDWLARTGIITCWWFSKLDQTEAVDPSAYIDVEQLYCGDTPGLAGLTLDQLFAATVSVVYKLHRQSDSKWRLVQMSFSRRDGKAGEGLSTFRIGRGLRLDSLLARDITQHGLVKADLLTAWNQRCLTSLDEALHTHWAHCVSATNIIVVS
jgi:hypothetical protein